MVDRFQSRPSKISLNRSSKTDALQASPPKATLPGSCPGKVSGRKQHARGKCRDPRDTEESRLKIPDWASRPGSPPRKRSRSMSLHALYQFIVACFHPKPEPVNPCRAACSWTGVIGGVIEECRGVQRGVCAVQEINCLADRLLRLARETDNNPHRRENVTFLELFNTPGRRPAGPRPCSCSSKQPGRLILRR